MTDDELKEANAAYHEHQKKLLKEFCGEEQGERLAEIARQVWINEIQGRDPLANLVPQPTQSPEP